MSFDMSNALPGARFFREPRTPIMRNWLGALLVLGSVMSQPAAALSPVPPFASSSVSVWLEGSFLGSATQRAPKEITKHHRA